MKHRIHKLLGAAIAGTLALSAGTALAALPPLKTQSGIEYVTGGVGRDEAQSFKEAQSKFPLALEFVRKAVPHDEFVANVDVTVTNRQGKNVLAVQTDGPFLLAKIPSGEYTVKATLGGHTLEKKVHISEHAPARAVFVWRTQG